MRSLDGQKMAGTFSFEGKEIYGELTLAGPKTTLYLRDRNYFSLSELSDLGLKGTLHDLTKVSLLRCITLSGPGSAARGTERYNFYTLFPHFVFFGDHHIGPNDRKVIELKFSIDDVTALFYDFDAFGHLIHPEPFISQLAEAQSKEVGRKIETGPAPSILYFTGKTKIFSAETLFGTISASHNIGFSLPDPKGLHLDNTILVTIAFNEAVIFDEALSNLMTSLRFLELIAGRPQGITELMVVIQEDHHDGPKARLKVYWSMAPRWDTANEKRKPHPADLLLDAVQEPKAFCNVLVNWIDRHETWKDARFRFAECFAKQNHYDHDRLIGAANMFDILPSSAVPGGAPLSDEIKDARDKSRALFKALPISPERDTVLNTLGRVGKANLKQKIRFRAEVVRGQVGDRFPDLTLVTDEAVNCRNHYVHGSEARFNYNDNFNIVTFLTNTLEFVFAASDLVEVGWDVSEWCSRSSTMSHPFDVWRINYKEALGLLKSLLPREKNSGHIMDT